MSRRSSASTSTSALFGVLTAMAVTVSLSTPASSAMSPPTLAKDKSRLKAIVLRPSDVPVGFGLVFNHLYTPTEIATQGTWTAAQLRYWRYEGGYEVQFDQGTDQSGPGQISSDAGAYRSVIGARRALNANGAACQKGLWQELRLDKALGDAAHLCKLEGTLRNYEVKVFFVVWTVGRFKGAITQTSLKSAPADAADAIALAMTQEKRMRSRR
jgi:hypothetical protein